MQANRRLLNDQRLPLGVDPHHVLLGNQSFIHCTQLALVQGKLPGLGQQHRGTR